MLKICLACGEEKKHKGKGLCSKCYQKTPEVIERRKKWYLLPETQEKVKEKWKKQEKTEKRKIYKKVYKKTEKAKEYAKEYYQRQDVKAKYKTRDQSEKEKLRKKNYRTKPEVQQRIKKYYSSIKSKYSVLVNTARKRGYKIEISFKQYEKIIEKNECFYCKDILPKTGGSLDRKDNSLDYNVDNVVACCKNCNTIKMNVLTFEEMIVAMKAVCEFRKKKI